MVEVFAAGNEGGNTGTGLGYRSIDSPGSAKNVITVGASEGVRTTGTDGCGLPDAQANNAGEILPSVKPRAHPGRAPQAGPGGAGEPHGRRRAPPPGLHG